MTSLLQNYLTIIPLYGYATLNIGEESVCQGFVSLIVLRFLELFIEAVNLMAKKGKLQHQECHVKNWMKKHIDS